MSPSPSPSSPSARSRSFEHRKAQCLAKRDRSSAGRVDARCEALCDLVNAKFPFYCTTSSCSGRSYLYRGLGAKGGGAIASFVRYRVSHDRIEDPSEHFDLSSVPAAAATVADDHDDEDGGDDRQDDDEDGPSDSLVPSHEEEDATVVDAPVAPRGDGGARDVVFDKQRHDRREERRDDGAPSYQPLWLRYEPFILHVACRSLPAAWHLMRVARPSFKNVGLTAWSNHRAGANASSQSGGRYVVAIWGDEGLDMPLESPDGRVDLTRALGREYLASLVNDRHERNWDKMRRFERALRDLAVDDVVEEDQSMGRDVDDGADNGDPSPDARATAGAPRSFDVIGDVAVLNAVGAAAAADPAALAEIGGAILRKNRALSIAVLRSSSLVGAERAPGDRGLTLLAGPRRDPLITTYVRAFACLAGEMSFLPPNFVLLIENCWRWIS
jgi:tRNA(Phe) wybutosine-synthesizing methylase Tyw3